MTEPVDRALERLAAGGIILVTGDALRGGDIDLVVAAKFADAAAVNFIAMHARGLICLALRPDAAVRLSISLLNSGTDRQSGRPFGQSIEARRRDDGHLRRRPRAPSRLLAMRQATRAISFRPAMSSR